MAASKLVYVIHNDLLLMVKKLSQADIKKLVFFGQDDQINSDKKADQGTFSAQWHVIPSGGSIPLIER